MNKGIIYKVTSPKGKVYIGQTIFSLERRRKIHIARSVNENFKIYNIKFYKSLRKYQEKMFWEIIEDDIPEQFLNIKECEYIEIFDSYKSGLNSTLGGKGTRGFKLTKEHKRKISLSLSGDKNPFFGRKHSKQLKKRFSQERIGDKNPFFGRKNDKHHLAKLTWEKVDLIRKEFETAKKQNIKLTHEKIGNKYGVTRSVITAILNNKKWVR